MKSNQRKLWYIYIRKCDTPPSELVLDGGRDKSLARTIKRAIRFLQLLLLLNNEYLLTSARSVEVCGMSHYLKSDISTIASVWTRQGQHTMTRIAYHVYQIRLWWWDEWANLCRSRTRVPFRDTVLIGPVKSHIATDTTASVISYWRYVSVDIGMRL